MKIPNMIYGTAWKKENTTTLVYEALMEGFRAIDNGNIPPISDARILGPVPGVLGRD